MGNQVLRFILTLCSALLIGKPSSAVADEIPRCEPPAGVVPVEIPQGMPSALTAALSARIGYIALPGESFIATDIGPPGRNWRYIFAWHKDRRWIVATEHGGIAYNDPIFVYELAKDGGTATSLENRISCPQTICKDAAGTIQIPN
jgi:hypothetical protein